MVGPPDGLVRLPGPFQGVGAGGGGEREPSPIASLYRLHRGLATGFWGGRGS